MNQIDCTPITKTMTNESTNWQVLTPSKAARAFASSDAFIVVRSWTQKGRGGRRGWTCRHTTFVSHAGKVCQAKSVEAGAYAYRIFVDLTTGAVEVCPWVEYQSVIRRANAAKAKIEAWLREHSDMPGFDALMIFSEILHSGANPAEVIRKDMNVLERLVVALPDQDSVGSLRDAATKASRGQK